MILRLIKRTKGLNLNRKISFDVLDSYSQSITDKFNTNTTPDERTLNRLFQLENFSKGVNLLVEKNPEKAEKYLKEALEDVFLEEIDTPSVLNAIFSRISIAQLEGNKVKELEETLKEIFIINLSDPNCDSETLFKSIFNLIVFYMKNDHEKGLIFEDFYRKAKEQTSLPLMYYHEIDMLFGILRHLKGHHKEAIEKYEGLLKEENEFMSRGLLLNNYAVCLMYHGVEEGVNNHKKIKEMLEDSILELEGNVLSSLNSILGIRGDESDDFGKEEEEKLRKFIFSPPEGKKSEDHYDVLRNPNSTLPLMNLSEIYLREKDAKK